MTREEIKKAYTVDDRGIIRSPGKFEGEMIYAPYFYNRMLDGFVDDEGETEDYPVDIFIVREDDRKEFPELNDVIKVNMRENDQGFVIIWTE